MQSTPFKQCDLVPSLINQVLYLQYLLHDYYEHSVHVCAIISK